MDQTRGFALSPYVPHGHTESLGVQRRSGPPSDHGEVYARARSFSAPLSTRRSRVRASSLLISSTSLSFCSDVPSCSISHSCPLGSSIVLIALYHPKISWWYIAPPSQRLYVGVSILRAAYSAPNKLRGGAERTRTWNQPSCFASARMKPDASPRILLNSPTCCARIE